MPTIRDSWGCSSEAGAFSSRVGGTEVSSRGRTFSGNWFGDSSPAGTWIEWKGEGLMFTGNTVGRARALRFLAGTQGETIQGNAFNANIVAIDFGVDLSVGDRPRPASR